MGKNITVIPAKKSIQNSNSINHSPAKLRMAAYCRVSTDNDEQLLSYENQVRYYTNYINESHQYVMADIYADEGISATNTKKRESFNRMIRDCRKGMIDMIITKSISRFARNTLDCLNYVRELKELGVGVIFEKENINTLDAKGEVLLTILSSLAQDESRSISENSQWGIRRRFENGQFRMSTKRFLGYDMDKNGKLVINQEQSRIVERIYEEYLTGKTPEYIKRIFEREGVLNWDGKPRWEASTIKSILRNEKYKGEAILQKTYTVDFLSKKRAKNKGEIQQYLIEENHDAIIDPLIWEAVQLETERRREHMKKFRLKAYATKPETNPFAGKIICGHCNKPYIRKTWKSGVGQRKVWQCQERYKVKGIEGCSNRNIDESIIEQACGQVMEYISENKETFMKRWEVIAEFGDPLEQYNAMTFSELSFPTKQVELSMMLILIEYIQINEHKMIIQLKDDASIEIDNNK